MAKKAVRKVSKKVAVRAPSEVEVGKVLPNFTLPATGSESEISVRDWRGKKIVLYFYPRDATPGCTVEGQDFSQLLKRFRALGAEVFGVSRDSLKSHEKFKEKQKYCMELLSDEDETVCKMFGVMKLKNMYGKMVRGIERSTFVIDQDGKLLKEWRGVKVPGHAEEVLEYLKTI